MFGMPGLPNLDEMAKMVADFQVRHERMVSAIERIEANQKLIMLHFNIEAASAAQVIEHDNGN